MDSFPDLYPLTSLQIGNVKSYLSRALLFFAPISHKFFILVDNQSWRMNKHSRSTHLREFMSTKYRMSPFRNSKALIRSQSLRCRSSSCQKKNLYGLFRTISMANLKEKAPFSITNLHKALHGFIVFEVSWRDVRGINYLNELQADASLALEVKSMRKWEFNGIDQALSCISSWFSGTASETETLQRNLIILQDKVPSRSSRGITVACKGLLFDKSSQSDLFSEDVFFDVTECPLDTDDKFVMNHGAVELMQGKGSEHMEYQDTLLLFRFNHRDLPFKLKQIITSDLKLLALLEAGLPSWVIFLQSYPLFCKVYRHWMRPLLRTLYILISLITVIIGFYDLYKNVPLLKATASHLCGPLFEWIEAWDMISRIRYLGTILFLQNLEKAVKWFLVIVRMMKLPMLLLTRPLVQPLKEIIEFLSPIWSIFTETGEQFYVAAWDLVEPFCSMVLDFLDVLLSPFEVLYSYISSLVKLICQLFDSVWDFLLISIQSCLVLANYVASLFSGVYDLFERVFMVSATSMGRLSYLAEVKPSTAEISHWHSLWNDLYSKVFRSLRNIINGLVAFFTSCNRHRLSIYNHLREIFWQLCYLLRLAPNNCSCRREPQVHSYHKVDLRKCGHCKQE